MFPLCYARQVLTKCLCMNIEFDSRVIGYDPERDTESYQVRQVQRPSARILYPSAYCAVFSGRKQVLRGATAIIYV